MEFIAQLGSHYQPYLVDDSYKEALQPVNVSIISFPQSWRIFHIMQDKDHLSLSLSLSLSLKPS